MKTQNKNYFEEQQSVRGDNIKELLRKQDEFHSSMTMLQQNINKVDEDGRTRTHREYRINNQTKENYLNELERSTNDVT